MRYPKKIVMSSPLTPEQIGEVRAIAPDAEWCIYPQYTAEPEALRDADVILGNVPPEMLKFCEKLEWMQICSAGTDGYMDVVPEGVIVTNGTGAYGPAISEHVLAMLLMLKRDMLNYHCDTLACRWAPRSTAETVDGSTVLILGLGDLGGNTARRLKALGAYVIGLRRSNMNKPEYCDELYPTEMLDELLPRADAVIMCLPNNRETVNIMDERRLFLMKKGSVLINVGRGTAIDQSALVRALDCGHLRGAGLDVVVPEPLPEDDPLWKARNILITPHVSGGWRTPSVVVRVKDILVRNLRAYINGEPLINIVDRSTGYRNSDK